VHGTATWDDATPTLLTAVTTTPATPSDGALLPSMQAPWATRQLIPREPLVAGGSVTSDHLLTSRTEHGRDLLGPVMADQSWPAQAATGCAAAHVVIDWDAKDALGPPGQRSVVGRERPDRHGPPMVRLAFRKPGCAACARRADCPRAATAPRA
jgi:transposase